MDRIDNPLVTLPTMPKNEEQHVFHIFAVRCAHREELQEYLRQKGIDTLIHYPVAPHRQGSLAEYNHLRFPIAERIANEVLSLPLSPILTEVQALRIAEAINEFNVE